MISGKFTSTSDMLSGRHAMRVRRVELSFSCKQTAALRIGIWVTFTNFLLDLFING